MEKQNKLENIKLIFKGIFLTIFSISLFLNIDTYNKNGFRFGNTSSTIQKPVARLSGIGYSKEDAEQLVELVDAVDNVYKGKK